MAPCDSTTKPYTPLYLNFVSAADVKMMSSDTAKLVAAAADGDAKAVKSILKDDPSLVDAADWDGATPLLSASKSGHLDVVKALSSSGASIDKADSHGSTPLIEACSSGHLPVVKHLHDKGASVDITNEQGVGPVWAAAAAGKADVLQHLIKKLSAPLDTPRADGVSALMAASVGGHLDAVKLLLKNGADANGKDNDGLTPAMNACEKPGAEVLKEVRE